MTLRKKRVRCASWRIVTLPLGESSTCLFAKNASDLPLRIAYKAWPVCQKPPNHALQTMQQRCETEEGQSSSGMLSSSFSTITEAKAALVIQRNWRRMLQRRRSKLAVLVRRFAAFGITTAYSHNLLHKLPFCINELPIFQKRHKLLSKVHP